MADIRVGLIGYGFAGATLHAPLISAVGGMTLARVASSNGGKVRLDFPGVEVASNPQQVIDAQDVDLIVVATPNAMHFPLARQALLAGKHVVVEKPFTVTVAEAQELLQLARERKRLLSVFQNRRWDSDFRTVQHCIASGVLGTINTYQAHRDRYRPLVRKRWREDGQPGAGTLYDLGAHMIDQALLLFGIPDIVWGDVFGQRDGALADDYFHLVLGYENTRVILHSGSIAMAPGPRFQVHGSTGSFVKYDGDPQEDALRIGQRPGGPSWGVEPEASYGRLTTERDGETVTETLASLPGSYQSFYQGMADAIAQGAPVPVEPVDALNVMKVIECAMQSSHRKTVVAFR